MGGKRKDLALSIFGALLKGQTGSEVPKTNVIKAFYPTKHPEVLSGRTKDQLVLQRLVDTFNLILDAKKSTISREDWLEYFRYFSASVEKDEYYQMILNNVWNVERTKQDTTCAPPVFNDVEVSVKSQCGTLRDALKLSNRIDAAKSHIFRDTKQPRRVTAFDPSTPAGKSTQIRDGEGAWACLTFDQGGDPGTQKRRTIRPASAGIQAIIDRLRDRLNERGAHGVIGLSRRFRIMDDDGNKQLSFDEVLLQA